MQASKIKLGKEYAVRAGARGIIGARVVAHECKRSEYDATVNTYTLRPTNGDAKFKAEPADFECPLAEHEELEAKRRKREAARRAEMEQKEVIKRQAAGLLAKLLGVKYRMKYGHGESGTSLCAAGSSIAIPEKAFPLVIEALSPKDGE